MPYTFAGVTQDAPSAASTPVSFNIGPTPSPFVVVAFFVQSSGMTGSTTMTVGGVPLTNVVVSTPAGYLAVFSGVATGLSGAQNFVVSAGGSFNSRAWSCWYMSNVTGVSHTGQIESGSPIPMNVTAGDYMFGIGIVNLSDFNNSTEAPQANHVITGANDTPVSADWIIVSTNPSFHVMAEVSGVNDATFFGAFASYTPFQVSPGNFVLLPSKVIQ